MDDINPHKAVHNLAKLASEYGKAKGNRVYLEQFRKSKKALLFNEAPDGTIPSKENYAYSHPDYLELLDGLERAVELEETYKFKLKSAELAIEIWRTESANNRMDHRASQIT